ncbi:hypothetical protein NQ315_006489 [Exocentrus adspersus]|uniref:Potassium channel tetramerisation-type BTB domain-containing protein n=1 Tax=Exocentrus adspersus TaxID=1586481 RepID=A0AAV8W098_9CUCU|nr:hypothetical protein NQ315_006489 [Exocentrus adspersus]
MNAKTYPESKLAKLFNGSIPIVLDSLKQHYFIDRDGGMFRHILNFMRNSRLLIPDNFQDLDLLLEEAKYFEITQSAEAPFSIKCQLEKGIQRGAIWIWIRDGRHGAALGADEEKNGVVSPKSLTGDHVQRNHFSGHGSGQEAYECVALHISPDLGERIMLSGDRSLLDEVFPETNQAVMDVRSGVAWNQQDAHHVIRFPLNGYCKLNSMQVITRLLNAEFKIAASNGGGVEGQQFSEYLFIRKVLPG